MWPLMLWITLRRKNPNSFFPCRKCAVCSINALRERGVCHFRYVVTSETYDIKSFITCFSKNIVYLLQCPCGLQYVCQTIRTMQIRVNKHLCNIQSRFPKQSVSKHYTVCHAKNPKGHWFWGLTDSPHIGGVVISNGKSQEWSPARYVTLIVTHHLE